MAGSSESNDTDMSDDEPIEYLATARAKRSTAGKHMGSLIDAEADDDLALLFAEDEEDEEFTFGEEEGDEIEGEGELEAAAGDDADDMQLDSSSDEEDQGPSAQVDELEGEKELEKEAKADRLAKKRKAHDSLRLTALRKRVRIDPSAASQSLSKSASRYRKRSERISWLPAADDGPTRSSSRKQTIRNKELTHARLKDSEKKRIRLIATMEEAAKRKEHNKPKRMTQMEKLAEAEKTERVNSKTLNRWEEMEKKRSEEQQAKLEALQNRRLEGPVATWWSGPSKWVNDRLSQVGIKTYFRPDSSNRKKRAKDTEGEEPPNDSKPEERPQEDAAEEDGRPEETAPETAPETPAPQVEIKKKLPKNYYGEGVAFLDGIHIYASMEEAHHHRPPKDAPSPTDKEEPQRVATNGTKLSVATPTTNPTEDTAGKESPATASTTEAGPPSSSPHAPGSDSPATTKPHQPLLQAFVKSSQNKKSADAASAPSAPMAPSRPALPVPKVVIYTRNYVILQDFDDASSQDRNDYNVLLNSRKPQKLQKPTPEYCPVTGRPGHYRDPQTGISYADSQAYREVRQVLAGRYAWSGFLGCFVGQLGAGARGVPERFLAPNAAPPKEFLATPTGTRAGSESESAVGDGAAGGTG
ncbi:hypothetical protein LOZ58_006277 [Ophidiomyces ophidiicola]|nr:hypothetical protein LOZ58_006277 [Ophidiomyces ophidiicola]